MTTTPETITFETLPLVKGEDADLGFYDGFTWNNFGAISTRVLKGDADGFDAVAHGHVVAGDLKGKPASFSSTTDFSLKSGYFAAGWDTGLHVQFTAYKDGVAVGEKTVILNQTSELIKFNAKFDHIDTVSIRTWGGTQGTGNGSGKEFAVDNLKVVFDGAIPTSASAIHNHVNALAAAHELGLHGFSTASDLAIAHPLHDWIML
jgi:hypothetical protein